MEGSARIEQLRAEARYRRERYDLYRARMYGLRPTTLTRLRELEHAWQAADARLRHAQQERTLSDPPAPASASDSRDG